MTQFNLDITKRSDAARKSTRRAENKLINEMNKAGGLEDERRYQLAELKREEAVLRKELHTLRFESKNAIRRTSEGYGICSRSSEDFFSMQTSRTLLPRRRSSDYGKNYFGYQSLPGSKKTIKKSTRELEKSLDDYCKKIDELMHEENIGKKLKEQQKENRSVQNKLNMWFSKTQSRGSTPQRLESNESDKFTKVLECNPKSPSRQLSRDATAKQSLQSFPAIEQSYRCSSPKIEEVEKNTTVKPDSAKSNKENKQTTFLASKSSLSDMTFNADLYAPDGRIRMAHRMPEIQIAFYQARKTRYVRTKEKRDFEIQLTVEEIFEKNLPSI